MIVLSLLWFWFGIYICKKNVCAHTDIKTEVAPGLIGATGDDCNSTLIITDKDGGLDISSAENFQFPKSSDELVPPTSDMAGVISQLADHLANNPTRFMQITGLYLESEENETEMENLGKSRAINVRAYLLAKGIDHAQITFAGKMDNEICTSEDKIMKGVSVSFNNIPN